MKLSLYINDTKQLLGDTYGSFYSAAQLLRWINESRRQCAMRTGCVRRLITGQAAFGASAQPGSAIPGAMQPGGLPPTLLSSAQRGASGGDFNSDFNADFSGGSSSTSGATLVASNQQLMTIPGVERYPYVGFFNPVLKAQHAGCDKVLDAIDLAVSWGTTRPSMRYLPWDEFQAFCRSYSVLNTSYPIVWSIDNDGSQGAIWLFPIPSVAAEMELDCFASPSPLNTDDDFDVIPDGFDDAIKFMAAGLIYLSSKRYTDAQIMENLFSSELGIARVAVDRGKTADYCWGAP